MGYTNSPLVVYTMLSQNNSGTRKHAIDRITPHCVVGQCTVEGLGEWFYPAANQVSSNYGIGADGRVGMYCQESVRSWCSSNADNDNRAVTIECASDTKHPYAFNDVVYKKLIELCVDICKRNGKKKLLWFGDKNKTLSYNPASDEMMLTVHQWFIDTICPGEWMMNRMNDLADTVTAALNPTETKELEATGLQAKELGKLTNVQVVDTVGPLFTEDQKKSGILASVSMAQFILESGYCRTELAQNANNCFGMKAKISGNTWAGSVWDNNTTYNMSTIEYNANGQPYTIWEDFRKYPNIEDSIADHSAYLLGAMNGEKKRYDGLSGCTDYKKAAQIIKNGGYATAPDYVNVLCQLIEMWGLTKWDVKQPIQTASHDTVNSSDTVAVSKSDWNTITEIIKKLEAIVGKYA